MEPAINVPPPTVRVDVVEALATELLAMLIVVASTVPASNRNAAVPVWVAVPGVEPGRAGGLRGGGGVGGWPPVGQSLIAPPCMAIGSPPVKSTVPFNAPVPPLV